MRVFIASALVVGLHGAVIAQPLGEGYWNTFKERADSVVISRFGSAFFNKHIFPPMFPNDFIVVGGYSCSWDQRDTITEVPSYCYFEYDIGFDGWNRSRLNIGVGIKPGGQLIEDEGLMGFIASRPPIAFRTDLKGFMQLARRNGIRCKRSYAYRELRWVPLDTTARVHPDGIGRYELILGRIRGERKENVGSSTYTYLILDAIVFDPFTGEVLRKEERRETLSIACGREFL